MATIVHRFWNALTDKKNGEPIGSIFYYFFPELITALIIYSGIELIDGYLIANLKETALYPTLGVTKTLLHAITKMTEGFGVGMVVLCGQYNGIGEYSKVGKVVADAFWVTCFLGALVAGLLYFGGSYILAFYGVPADIAVCGLPFLQLRAIGVFFQVVSFALIGFMRGVKNTRVPMFIFILGALTFVLFDVVLVLGYWGFPCLALKGSAIASILQALVVFVSCVLYIVGYKENRKYGISLLQSINGNNVASLVLLSLPVIIDKASLAISYTWLVKKINSLPATQEVGRQMLASYTCMRDFERFMLLPALAFASVLTFLISNDYRRQNWDGMRANLARILVIALSMVGFLSLFLVFNPGYFISIFDKNGSFLPFAVLVVPVFASLLLIDVLQCILSAMLRGAACVRVVMWVRVGVCGLFLFPVAHLVSLLPIANPILHFILLYGVLYASYGLMGILFILYLRRGTWKKMSI